MKKRILLTIIMLLILCSGCESQRMPKDADTSLNLYQTRHFNGDTLEERVYTANNGEDIFYYDNHQIKRKSDGAIIQENVQPICMVATPNAVMYITENNELCIVNIKDGTSELLEADASLWAVLTDGEYIFAQDDKRQVYYVKAEDASRWGKYAQLGIEDEKASRVNDMYYQKKIGETSILIKEETPQSKSTCFLCINENYVGWVKYSRLYQTGVFFYKGNWFKEASKGIMWLKSEENKMVMDYFKPAYNFELRNYYKHDEYIYKLSHSNYFRGRESVTAPSLYDIPQKNLVTDRLEVYNLETFKKGIVYETKDNWERIIGFDGEYIYLMDVKTYTINKYNPETKEKEYWHDLPEQTSLVFEWCGDALFVYDEEDNCLEILE